MSNAAWAPIDYRQPAARLYAACPARPALAVTAVCVHHIAASGVTVDELISALAARGKAETPGIGYHYYVNYSGIVYTLADPCRVTYHNGYGRRSTHGRFSACNWSQVGVALEGRLMRDRPPTAMQCDAFRRLHAYLEARFGPLPVVGHKDFGKTACPGDWWPGRKDLLNAASV